MTRVLVLCCMMVLQSVDVLAQAKGESYLKAHFAACLSRNEVLPVKKDKQLRLSSIEKYRQQVWQAWKQANEASAEEPLLPLDCCRKQAWRNGICPIRWNLTQ